MPLDKLALAVLAVLFWGVFILFFLFNTLRCAHEWSILSWLARSGINVDGQIVSLKMRAGGKSGRFFAVYQFHPNTGKEFGSKINAEQQVSLRHSNKLTVGTSVAVRFLSFAPNISRLAGDNVDNTVRDSTTFFAILTILFIPFLFVWLLIFLFELYPPILVAFEKHIIPKLFL